ncbi:MAG: hypothetical protein AAGC88_09525 [Bacteroidota bacterium]
MNLNRYNLQAGEKLEVFEFISEGPKGRIPKIVQYFPTNYKELYHLGFGDKNQVTGEIDDTVVSNNSDSEKVLATVIATLYAFTDQHRGALVYATGSTDARTRLYRMGISKYLKEAQEDFEIYGELEDQWELFKTDRDYKGFLIVRK